MKKRRWLIALCGVFLGAVVLALAADNLLLRIELGKARANLGAMPAELAQARLKLKAWEIYADGTMNYMRAMSYDDTAAKIPEEKPLPEDAPERLYVLASRVEKRLGTCVVDRARLRAEKNGFKGQHTSDGW